MSDTSGFVRIVIAMVVVVVTAAVAFLCFGTVWVNPGNVFQVILGHLGIGNAPSPQTEAIVWNIRMPRLLVAAVAGAGLGVAGTVLQGTFRNPIADPQLIGLSAFASVGALTGFWFGYTTFGPQGAVVAGAAAGVVGALIVRWIGTRSGSDPERFILVGIGTGLAVGAIVATASIAIHDPRVPDVTYWFFGGLSTATWPIAGWTAVLTVVSVAGVIPLAGRLDILSLGNNPARHLGVNVGLVIALATVFAGLGVGAGVGAMGVVGFVGLVGGRVASEWVGPHHRHMIPVAGLAGASFVIMSDLFGRVIGHGFEVPVGLITTAIGGVFLVGLILKNRVSP